MLQKISKRECINTRFKKRKKKKTMYKVQCVAAMVHESMQDGKSLRGRSLVGVCPLSSHRCQAQSGKEAPDSPFVLARGNSRLGVGPKRCRARDCDANRSNLQCKQTSLQVWGSHNVYGRSCTASLCLPPVASNHADKCDFICPGF